MDAKSSNRVERNFSSARHRDYDVTIYLEVDTYGFPANYQFDNFADMAPSA